ncbi:putative HTH-type transcriptional regulator YdfH [Pseudoruegeria aquimaris]|uniref:Putative HTH-type transcriptional regulator YdfH n=1 Tax=Pseudoruegeria aquimaris TaxID=393663 RepID=A0A1Y5SZN1_9RHOB|nr:GntR family transcriptional regulator [Pseudoruegeria aquimaris]SLN52010.1 putative HTH-type transcriptional regulator YdfH [Pseudoruegeria aquimaris]
MANAGTAQKARSSVDRIVERLYDDIRHMRLLPGTRISETDIAAQFGVSRQPVRDAFNRLANMDLIIVRPKKATEVKKFSVAAIERSRFVRASVEKEVLRLAAQRCTEADGFLLDSCISLQHKAMSEGDNAGFTQLDYEFHKTLCDIARVPYAFDVIRGEKEKVDRLCMLQLSKENRMPQLVEDHEAIAEAVKAGDPEAAAAAGATHLSRLDDTIAAIRITSAAYFDDSED